VAAAVPPRVRAAISALPRRDAELALLGAAAPVILLAFALVKGATQPALAASDFLAPLGLLIAFALAHLAARRYAPAADPALLPTAALLSGIGLAMLSRLDAAGSGPALAGAQALWLLAGAGALIATLVLVPSLERLARFKYSIMLAGLVLLLLPAVVGREINGAKLWLRIGGMSFQPAEVAKVLVVLFLAAYLAENREVLSVSTRRFLGFWLPPARQIAPLVLMWVVSLVILVAEKDLGSSLLFFGVFLAMVHVATGRAAYTAAGVLLFVLGAAGAYLAFAHVRSRVGIWLDPFADPSGAGYQLVQSLFSLGAGGVTGTGLGRGLSDRIPYVATDFIFSAIGEELGLLGAAAVVTAYLVLCVRGLATAVRARSDMAALTAAGLVASLGLQTFVIVGGVTRLIPLTGITLPFVSYGGSSVLANFVLLGLLMRAGDGAPEDGAERPASRRGPLGRTALVQRLTGLAWLVVALVLALIANLTYIQVVAAPALAANPANTRGLDEELRAERGAIVTRDGVVLARSVPAAGRYRRTYPAGSLAAHVVGYYSARYGRSGVEAAANGVLAGHSGFADVRSAMDDALGTPSAGNDVVLTIDSRIQAAAERALAGRRGACVAIDPRTGEVLALASSPTYEPASVDARWAELSKGGGGAPLVDRALSSVYPPGSTFKVVTLTGALTYGVAGPSSMYPGPAVLEIGGGKVTNFEGGGYGSITLAKATASSVNTVFAQVADQLGAPRLVTTARGFGFDKPTPFDLPVTPSLMSAPEAMTRWETAWAGVGQPVGAGVVKGPVATPLEMALVAAGIANAGIVMEPRILGPVTGPSGETVLPAKSPAEWTKACDPAVAVLVRDLMVGVVKSGSGTRAAIKGVRVAGKTGTAEVGRGLPTHAWFIAFAPAERPVVALAIVLENAGVGGRVAAPAAKGVLEAALAVQR
jgi:cell division protein FtsW (lipid II flippase)/cell division protein FtsI/penicillin-binding protein 2